MTQPDFIQIPTQLLADKTLQPSDRILFGYIYWMTKLAMMKCVAGNDTLSELTGLSRRGVQQSLLRLEQQGYVRRIFIGTGERHRSNIECLIAFSALKPKKANMPVRTNVRSSTNKRALTVRTNVRHNKKREEEVVNKNVTNVTETDVAVSYGKPEINEMFEYWNERTGVSIESNVKRNRNACNSLYVKYGTVKLRQLIDGVALAQSTPYAPQIADFVDLQFKLTKLITWGKNRNQLSQVVVIS